MPLPSAARAVAAASTSPGTGARSSGRPPRQVTQTKIVIALAVTGATTAAASPGVRSRTVVCEVAVSAKVTRPHLEGVGPGWGAWRRLPLDLPACPKGHGRRMNAITTEAPRPAHARIDGRSPGSRVTARHRLPGFCPVALWYGLAAYSCGGSCGIENRYPAFAPHSLLALLSRDRRLPLLNGRCEPFVNERSRNFKSLCASCRYCGRLGPVRRNRAGYAALRLLRSGRADAFLIDGEEQCGSPTTRDRLDDASTYARARRRPLW
jgi:hypothetical protein